MEGALLGRKVDAYYPVSKHFCWSGTVTAVEGRRVRVKCDDFENLEDWFGIENVLPSRPAEKEASSATAARQRGHGDKERKRMNTDSRNGNAGQTLVAAICSALRVEAAAKRQPDGKIISRPPPARHDDLEGYGEKGFLLSDGTWCNRARAESVARESGQLTGPIRHAHLKGLSTDDLW